MASPRVFPIFPLESVVLVPGALLPLHVFEPRYRQMLGDVLEGDRMVAMAMPREGHSCADEEAPPVHPVVQLGRVVRHRTYEDGRADIVLEGVARMRIDEELPAEHAYRMVRAQPLPDVSATDDASLRESVRALVRRFPDLRAEDVEALCAAAPGRTADTLLLRLPVPARDKHRIAADPDPALRIDALHRLLDVVTGRAYPLEVRRGDPRLN